MVDLRKNILTSINLYHGIIKMPKGFEIDNNILQQDILTQNLKDCPFPFSREWDKLHCYLREHLKVEDNLTLVNKETTSYMFKPDYRSMPILDVNPVDLRNSPDYTMLYGVNVDKCSVRIYYDSNRRKGRSWDINLHTNSFIIFPSSQIYCIYNNQKDALNFVLKTTHEYI